MKLLLNERGNLALALVLAVMGVMSGVTMSSLAMRDAVGLTYDYDSVQALHCLRSETQRGKTIVEKAGVTGTSFFLNDRYVQVASSNSKMTVFLRSKLVQDDFQIAEGGFRVGGYTLKTTATPSRGIRNNFFGRRNDSIVRRYGEYRLRRTSFSEFHYFTDNESAVHGDNIRVKFWGPDVISGRVHSNTDIYVQNAGGGNNGNWPLFWDLVTTAGEIKSYSNTPPYDGGPQIPYQQVFRGGYIENYHTYEYPPLANNIRNFGQPVGFPNETNRIFYVQVNGTSYNISLGTVTENRDFADVYPYFPPPTGTPILRNVFTNRDTVWTSWPSFSIINGSAFFFNKVWLKGNFRGMQTIGSADTLYLVGDITYFGTTPGSPPDTPGNWNRSDITGLVSEKSIIIKYGYRDPEDSTRYHPNCGADGMGIYIYGALCALGQGDTSFQDGVFSYEYQHPHPSTPSYNVNGQIYSRIDLHRYRYPAVHGITTWPTLPPGSQVVRRQALDLPYYNPLWPERQPFTERGTINLWGSVAQRRRGFVHRSGNDGDYPSNSGVWNVPLDMCGYPVNSNWTEAVVQGGQQLVFQPINYPGASGTGTGYKKNYNFDDRFKYTSPIHFPDVNLQGGQRELEGQNWVRRHVPKSL